MVKLFGAVNHFYDEVIEGADNVGVSVFDG